jgi:hypothetical protein
MTATLILGVLVAAVMAGPAQADQGQQPTTLTIQTHDQARLGEPHEATVVLTDARGRPLVGETVTVLEELRLFDYADTVPVAEVRTDYRGAATVAHLPAALGRSRLLAEYAGSETFAPAAASALFTVADGAGLVTPVLPAPSAPLLPRGVTAAWFLPLLIGVWLALGGAVYHVVRIPREGQARAEAG